jgi:hypothetical protein
MLFFDKIDIIIILVCDAHACMYYIRVHWEISKLLIILCKYDTQICAHGVDFEFFLYSVKVYVT